jgi:cytidylate kinase
VDDAGSTDTSRDGIVVALDGPASSGKSSVGAAAAKELGYRFCDTGLLYRAVTWLALDRKISASAHDELTPLVGEVELLDVGDGRLAHVAIDGVDRTADVRAPAVDIAVSAYSAVAELRLSLLERQRALALAGRIIMAGRDVGTIVLPDADLKLFLDASVEERARRRAEERGVSPSSAVGGEILEELQRRDMLDSTRAVAPLRAAPDAVVIRTDGNAFEQTVAAVVEAIRNAEPQREESAVAPADGVSEAPEGHDATEAQEPVAEPRESTSESRDLATSTSAPAASTSPAPADEPKPAGRPARSPRGERNRTRVPIRPTPIATRRRWLYRFGNLVLRAIARSIARLKFEGDVARIPRTGPLILASNHASAADPVLITVFLANRINRPINWLGKRELVEWPPTGWAFREAAIHPVDREAADLEAFRTAMRILDAGQVLAIFPEGTRSRDGALQQVREGAGMLALRSGANVLPVAVVDSDRLWPRGRLLPKVGRTVTVRYGAPIDIKAEMETRGVPTRGREATEAATRLIMTRIAELLPPRQRGVYAEDVASSASSIAASSDS